MRTTLFLFFLAAIQVMAQDSKMNSVTKIIEEIKNKYAPDKRLTIFNISSVQNESTLILSGETNIPEARNDLNKKLKSIGVNFRDEIHSLPEANLGGKIYGIVNVSVANMRSKPSDSAELASQLLLGSTVNIYKKNSGFYLIQSPDNYISWLEDDGSIVPINKSQLNEWLNSEKIIYVREYGFSYSEPSETSVRVSDLTAGNILVNLGEERNYYKVKYPDGRIAFIEKAGCERLSVWLNKKIPTEADIINTAFRFIGIPYLWGGTSAKAMDCSGFTKTVYFLNRVILPRDASQQVNTGIPVDTQNGFENLSKGDLLFFGFRATDSTKERITHVGIYLGDLRFIHASGRVKINSLDKNAADFSEFRLTHFIRAKRIINSEDRNGISSVKNNKFYVGGM